MVGENYQVIIEPEDDSDRAFPDGDRVLVGVLDVDSGRRQSGTTSHHFAPQMVGVLIEDHRERREAGFPVPKANRLFEYQTLGENYQAKIVPDDDVDLVLVVVIDVGSGPRLSGTTSHFSAPHMVVELIQGHRERRHAGFSVRKTEWTSVARARPARLQ